MAKGQDDPVLSDPAGHFPYARDRAEKAGIPAEMVDVSERIVEAERAWRLDPVSVEARAEYDDAVAEAERLNAKTRGAATAPSGDAVRVEGGE